MGRPALLLCLVTASFLTVTNGQLLSSEGVCPGAANQCLCYSTVGYSCPSGYYCPYAPGTFSGTIDPNSGCSMSGNLLQCKCTPGMFCPNNTAQPIYCCKGHYCPTPEVMYVCPEGSFCIEGFVEHISCNPGNNCPEGSESEEKLTSLILAIFIIIAILIIFKIKKVLHQNKISIDSEKMLKYKEARRLANSKLNHIPEEEDSDPEKDKSGSKTNTEVYDVGEVGGDNDGDNRRVFDIDFDSIGLKLPTGVTVMQGVTGSFKSGRTCAIMGPSGAGKTTIMSLVTGKAKKTQGTIRVNGVEEDLYQYRKLIGFVPQEDVMHRELTVLSNIKFSANTRLPTSMTAEEREQLVLWTIDTLEISHVQHSIIGSEEERGISGGQRKRVNVGLELVADPSILFLDEPTSGLDSSTSLELCYTLRDIARRKRMVVAAVIHQPSPGAFAQFDDLLLLGKGGRTVYTGPVEEAEAYFNSIGFPMPKGENPADFFLDVTSGKIARVGEDEDFDPAQLFVLWEQHLGRTNTRTSTQIHQEDDVNRSLMEHWNPQSHKLSFWQKVGRKSKDIGYMMVEWLVNLYHDFTEFVKEMFTKDEVRETPGFFLVFWYCLKRAFLQIFRQPGTFLGNQLIHLAVGSFISVAAQDAAFVGPMPYILCTNGVRAAQKTCLAPLRNDIQSIAVFLAWGVSFAGIASGIQTFGNERVVFWRESAAGLSSLAYFMAKVTADFVRVVSATAFFFAFFTFGYTNVGDQGDLFVIIMLLYWFGFAMGYFISQIAKPVNAALLGVALSLVFCVVYGGNTPSVQEVENDSQYKNQRFIWDVSAPRWAIEGLFVNQLSYYKTVPSGPLEGQVYMNLTSGVSEKGYDIDNFDTDVQNTLLVTIGWLVLGFIFMKLTHRSKKV
eukprot:Nk52_evm63s914 gene=Nk52_evmTU63s914